MAVLINAHGNSLYAYPVLYGQHQWCIIRHKSGMGLQQRTHWGSGKDRKSPSTGWDRAGLYRGRLQ